MNFTNIKNATESDGSVAQNRSDSVQYEHTIKQMPVPDLSQAQRFLTLLDEDNEHFTFEAIEEPKPKQRSPKVQRYHGTLETYSEVLRKSNQQGYGIFVAVNDTDGKGRKKENVNKIRAFFVDLDGSPMNSVRQAPLDPHIIVESSPGRYHVYWLVEDVPLDCFASMQKQLAQKFGGDPSVCDLPRLMRIPGFLHRKHSPYLSRILETSVTQPYSFQKFQAAFDWDKPQSSPARQSNEDVSADPATLIKLREMGLVKHLENKEEGRWLIRCPWANEHTNSEEAYYFYKPILQYKGIEGFKCFHAHCQERDIRTLRFFLGLPPAIGVEPLPLFREITAPPPFPVEALGPVMGKAAIEIHRTVQAPLAVIGQSLLGAASLLAQGHANVEIDGREIALSLFLITVAESGERKSAVDDVVLCAVLGWQRCLWNTYREERSAYEAALEKWQEEKKNCNNGEADSEGPPAPPLMPIIVVEEPTYEGLVKYLEHGQPSIGLFSDEGGRFLGGNAMNRDNLLKTLAGFSSLWDAKSNKPITRMRSGDQSLALYGRRVALHLLIQESVYSKLNQQSMCESQGFLPRCLISFPESMAGNRVYVTENPKELPSVKLFREHCNALLDRQFPTADLPAPKNQLAPPSIPLAANAYINWVEFHNKLEQQLGKQGVYYPIRRFGSKAAEHVLRIAGVFAIFENPLVSEIGEDHINRAIEIIEYYLIERLRLDSYCCIDFSLLTAQKVLDWAEAKGKPGVLLKELYQFGPPDVRSKEKASAILKILEDHGRAFPVPAREIEEGAKGKGWRFIWPS